MCGICGYVGPPDNAFLKKMRDVLLSRGPDDAGEFEDHQVSLGHRRLAIIDLNTGHQPMTTVDGSLTIVFNGEIYNYRQLRKTLLALGREFRTQSDTEVILQAYAQFGSECVQQLDGMFAFVIYDHTRQRLFGARDRFGKKPLFYATALPTLERDNVSFAFASEIKALRQFEDLEHKTSLSADALTSYLLHDYVQGEQRIFKNVMSLPAGAAFTFSFDSKNEPPLTIWKYWEPKLKQSSNVQAGASFESASRNVLTLLEEAVVKRLVADVLLGALLSGGVDSSAIVALMAKHLSSREIETFCIGFDDSSFDESQYAATVAQRLGVRHQCRLFTAQDVLERFDSVIAALDEPFADPSILPTSLLCEFARGDVTVVLSGDGGDELFAGYDPFRAIRAAGWYRSLVPAWLHNNVISPALRWLPVSTKNMSFDFKLRRFLRGAMAKPGTQMATWMGAFTFAGLQRLLPAMNSLTPDIAFAPITTAFDKSRSTHSESLDTALDFFQRFYLTDDILVKVDRASMMHSLEVRSPFLDTALVEFVNSLPSSWKLRGNTSKYILKHALLHDATMSRLLPSQIIHRKKKGFGIPVAHWIRHELRAEFQETLVENWPATLLPMIDSREVRRLLEEHQAGKENHYKEVWALFVLARWVRVHLRVPQSVVTFQEAP